MTEQPVQRRGQERRERLAHAAAAVALRDGISALSHRAVAAEAGVPLGSTTYYFDSLTSLRVAAVERLLVGDRERREAVLAGGAPAGIGAPDLAWKLLDAVIALGRLDEPRQVALLYERIAEAARAPELAAVVRTAAEELEADVARLASGTAWDAADPAALVALVDGRAIGWLAKGDHRPHLLVDGVAADLARHRGS